MTFVYSNIFNTMLKYFNFFKYYLLGTIILLAFCFAPSTSVLAEVKVLLPKDVTGKEMVQKEKYYWIVYDSVCPYCRSARKYIKQLDWEGKFKFLSYRDPLTYELFPKLIKKECEKDVHMVTPKGEILFGYKVFRTIIDNLTATKLLNPLFKNDYAETKLNEIYEKMVKKRSCYYNKTDACELHLDNGNEKQSESD